MESSKLVSIAALTLTGVVMVAPWIGGELRPNPRRRRQRKPMSNAFWSKHPIKAVQHTRDLIRRYNLDDVAEERVKREHRYAIVGFTSRGVEHELGSAADLDVAAGRANRHASKYPKVAVYDVLSGSMVYQPPQRSMAANPPRNVWLVCRDFRRTRVNDPPKGGPSLTIVVDADSDLRVAARIAERLTEETGKPHFVSPGTELERPQKPGIRRPRRRRSSR